MHRFVVTVIQATVRCCFQRLLSVLLSVLFVSLFALVFQFVRGIFPFFYKNLMSIKNKSSLYFPRNPSTSAGNTVKKEETIAADLYSHR